MSIVVKNPFDKNRMYVFSKGADEAIFKILRKNGDGENGESEETMR